jgi:hypothetical protein
MTYTSILVLKNLNLEVPNVENFDVCHNCYRISVISKEGSSLLAEIGIIFGGPIRGKGNDRAALEVGAF